ncbi:hypothetical protein [Streptomyces sp. AK04-3B]|uniref:hypothetical protein n=1 Tax=unclassified Streptomyces TaxID=2593676 RepID=UPI0029BAEDA3|nr:hypothetical protein [Streptomyces sp. AK04-3B]MDX3798859.1 hypothetical protein [Streptomyces sp. AK04-3B]
MSPPRPTTSSPPDRPTPSSSAANALRNPYWPQHAALELGAEPRWPEQHGHAVRRSGKR